VKLLLGAIAIADRVVTVSPSYREEVLNAEGGWGLHVSMYVCMYVCVCVCKCIYICIYIYMYACYVTYIHTYIPERNAYMHRYINT
jgi:hypothetical protein